MTAHPRHAPHRAKALAQAAFAWLARGARRLTGRVNRQLYPPAHGGGDRRLYAFRRRMLLAAFLTIIAYPVLGTLALWTGFVEWLIESEDARVEIDNPAWTIIPGRVHMKRARILVNGETQFTLEGKDLIGTVQMLELFRRRFHVTRLEADDVRYRMRVQVESTRGIEQRLAAYPPLEGLPGTPALTEQEGDRTETRESSWTVHVEGIDVRVSELWFFEYRYLGPGTLKGGFLRGPGKMRVETAVQDLGPGELRFGPERLIARHLRGRITAEIPEIDPEKHADASLLPFVTAGIELKADVLTLRHVGAYLKGLQVRDGGGPFEADIQLVKGHLGKDSRLLFATDELRLLGDEFGVKTDWNLQMRVVGSDQDRKQGRSSPQKPELRSKADASYVSFAGPDRQNFTIQVLHHEQGVRLSSTKIDETTEIERAFLDFPRIISRDLDDLGALIDEKKTQAARQIETKQGVARASLRLEMNEDHVLRGPFQATLDDVKLVVAGVRLGGSGRLRSQVRVDLDRERTTLSDIGLGLSDVEMYVGDEDVEGWWMKMSSKRLSAWGLPPKRFQVSFAVRAKDAEPLLEALAEKDELNDLIAKFTSLDDINVNATLRVADGVTDLMLDTVESDVWDVSGRIYSRGKRTQSALLIGGEAFALGLYNDGENSEIKPFAGAGWLNEKLRRFPKPIELVKPPKP